MQIRLKPLYLGIMILVLMFGGISLSGILNYWKTESTKVPAKYTSGEYEGTYNPADIRGSYSFSDISEHFDIPLEHLAMAFGLKESENAEVFLCKNLETRYAAAAEKGFEIGTDSVRVFVALYKGLPIELADTYIPLDGYQILKDNADLSVEQIEYLDSHSVDLSMLEASKPVEETVQEEQEAPIEQEAPAEQKAPVEKEAPFSNDTVNSGDAAEIHESGEERLVKGKTTFRELLDWGITEEETEQILGKDMPSAAFSVRDFCEQQGIEFSTIKTELQSILDKK